MILRAGVVDEVLRQAAGAVVVVTELFVEVVDDRRIAPPGDRNQEVVEQPERRDRRCRADERPHERHQLVAAEEDRTSQKVGAHGNQVVLEREPDRRAVGQAAERVLRQNRVHANDEREAEGEDVHSVNAERQPSVAHGIERHSRERNREQDLLPRLDGGERASVDPGPIERGHHSVVQGEADDPGVERQDRPPPDDARDGNEQEPVDREREPRCHRARLIMGGDAERPRPLARLSYPTAT